MKLTTESSKKRYKCNAAWVLAYSSHMSDQLLEEVELEESDAEAEGNAMEASLAVLNGVLPAEPPAKWKPEMLEATVRTLIFPADFLLLLGLYVIW